MRSILMGVGLLCWPCLFAQSKSSDLSEKVANTVRTGSARTAGGQTPALSAVHNANSATRPANAPVITLKGVCPARKQGVACRTVITRAELDRSLDILAGESPQADRGRLAVHYGRTVALSTLAEREGLDKNPELAEEIEVRMKLARMKVLATVYLQNLQKRSIAITSEEIEKYYEAHAGDYEQVEVRRLAVPVSAPTETGLALSRPAIRSELQELRKRAMSGEDFNELQKEAYKHLGIQATPPPMNLLTVRRENLQGDEAKALDLKAGDVSDVLDAPAALVIMKVESKQRLPLGYVSREIQATLAGKRVQDGLSDLAKTVNSEFDLSYLGLSAQPDLFAPGSIGVVGNSGPARRTVRPRRMTAASAAPLQR